MKTRKVISAVLAGACALSAISFSALADTVKDPNKAVTATGGQTYKIASAPVVPKIDVSIPSKIAVVVNPYGVSVSDGKDTYGAAGVASPNYTIRNFTTTSAIAVEVTASLSLPTKKTPDGKNGQTETWINVVSDSTGMSADSMKALEKKTLGAYVIGKAASAELEGTKAALDLTKETGVTSFPPAEIGEVASETNEWKGAVIFADVTETVNEEGTKVKANNGKENKGVIMTLKKASEGKYTYGQFAVCGVCTPMTGKAESWDKNDKITFNLVLDLQPSTGA